jgi:hypothetical protein
VSVILLIVPITAAVSSRSSTVALDCRVSVEAGSPTTSTRAAAKQCAGMTPADLRRAEPISIDTDAPAPAACDARSLPYSLSPRLDPDRPVGRRDEMDN